MWLRACLLLAALMLFPVVSLADLQSDLDDCDFPGPARGGCTIDLGPGVFTISDTLRIGRSGVRTYGVHLKGAGSGAAVEGTRRTECPTTIRYDGPPDRAILEIKNIRSSKITGICFDGGDRAAIGATLSCEKVAANCGTFAFEDVLFMGWRSAESIGVLITEGPDGPVAFERITLDQVRFASSRDQPDGPQIAVLQNLRNSDHLQIRNSVLRTCGAQIPHTGLLSLSGNFALEHTIVANCDNAPEHSMAVVIKDTNDWFHIAGLVVEGRGHMGGVRIETGRDGLRNGAILSSEIKVPQGATALEVLSGGSLSLAGTRIGVHGGGDPNQVTRVNFAPAFKQLYLCDSLRPSKFYSITKNENVVDSCP